MPPTRECRGRPPLCRGLGCPQKPLFFSLAAVGGKQKERKRVFRGQPEPRQGGPCTPSRHPPVKEALPITNRRVKKGLTAPKKLGMTHFYYWTIMVNSMPVWTRQ